MDESDMAKALNVERSFFEYPVVIASEVFVSQFKDMIEWLEARSLFLRRDFIWTTLSGGQPTKFLFKEQQDALLFKMVFG